MEIFLWILLVVGIGSILFGLRLLFEKNYVDRLEKGIWKPKYSSTDKGTHHYNKYVTGIHSLVMGIIALTFALIMLL